MGERLPAGDVEDGMTHKARVILQRLKEAIAPSYRPELHYMRGPGPAARRRPQPSGRR